MSKSFVVNSLAVLCILVSFLVPHAYAHFLLFTGLFALSGAVTNQLAIYMLFERVPFLYGSGVIEKNFEIFKIAIKNMMMQEFFTPEKLQHFFEEKIKNISLESLVDKADFSPAFDALSKTVMESKFGGAVSMFGGVEALEGLRDTFVAKLKKSVSSIVSSKTFQGQLHGYLKETTLNSNVIGGIENIIEQRLAELTPKMVKDLIQSLIRKHLGWLVVWGAVFGGLIGFISSFWLY